MNKNAMPFQKILWIENTHARCRYPDRKKKLLFQSLTIPCIELINPDVETVRAALLQLRNYTTLIIIAGGDGTVNRLLPLVSRTDFTILPLPQGTGNDLYRGIGESFPISDDLLTRIRSAKTTFIDLISVNGHLFATTGGLGNKSIQVIRHFNNRDNRSFFFKLFQYLTGKLSYVIYGTFLTLLTLRFRKDLHNAQISADEYDFQPLSFRDLFILNFNRFAGVYRLAPGSNPADSKAAIVRINPPCYFSNLLNYAGILFKGLKRSNKLNDMRSFHRLNIKLDYPLDFFGDGEILCRSDVFEIRIIHQTLKILL